MDYYEEGKRKQEFTRNDDLELYLSEINGDLHIIEDIIVEREGNESRYPIIFVMGPLRSGTTMIMQWLADIVNWSGDGTGIAYPTNLMSRFYAAPIMGSKIQRLLTDEKYNFRNEIMDFSWKCIDYISHNGKTKGALSPNEFWYFWRHYLPFQEKDYCSDGELLAYSGTNRFCRELNGMANVFEKPFALKGMICNYNIGFLKKVFPNSFFIRTYRQPAANIEAVLQARKEQFGDESVWYSFKIPEYEKLKELEYKLQAAGQIYHINQHISKEYEKIEEDRKVLVDYEEFCLEPQKVYRELQEKLAVHGYILPENYRGISKFSITRKGKEEFQKIFEQYQAYIKD